MKKTLIWCLVVVLSFVMMGCSQTPTFDDEFSSTTSSTNKSNNREGSKKGTAHINDCYIEIKDCKAQISIVGEFIAVVWIDFSNNSDAATSLFHTAQINAYQNGVQLSPPVWAPADHGITNDDSDNVQPGYKISTGCAFDIKDSSAPITIQICKGSTVISEKTFNI